MTETVAPPQETTSTEAPAEKKTAAKTAYVVLKEEPSGVFTFVENVYASSSDAAIKSLNKEGRYVATPARSFNPKNAAPETKTTLKLT